MVTPEIVARKEYRYRCVIYVSGSEKTAVKDMEIVRDDGLQPSHFWQVHGIFESWSLAYFVGNFLCWLYQQLIRRVLIRSILLDWNEYSTYNHTKPIVFRGVLYSSVLLTIAPARISGNNRDNCRTLWRGTTLWGHESHHWNLWVAP